MPVALSMKESYIANDVFVTLVKTNPDVATQMLVQAGHTEEEAAGILGEVNAKIALAVKQEALSTFRDEVKVTLLTAITELPEPDATEQGKEIDEVKCEVRYTRDTKTESDGTKVVIGWYLTEVKTRLKGEERLTAAKKPRQSGGASRASVPVPEELKAQGFNSWKQWADHLGISTEGRSAPRELEKANDEVYLNAKSAAGV